MDAEISYSISVYSLLFKEVIIFCSLPFLYVEAEIKNCDHQNPLVTVCLTLAIFLGTSAAQPIVPENSVCPLDPTTVQQQVKEGETTLGNKSPKKLGKRGISESSAEHGTHNCIFAGTILYMECMEEKINPFLLH